MKSKIKYSLIDDYIQICKIYNSVINYFNNKKSLLELKAEAERLKKLYEYVFLRLGMIDDSFFHLKKELELTKQCQMIDISKRSELLNCKNELENISSQILNKLNKLSFTPIEQKFIMDQI